MTSRNRPTYDWGLLSITLTLLAVGIVMVFSASYPQAINGFNDPFYFILRQVIWIALGVVAMVVAARIPYRLWERFSVPMMGMALLSLLAVVAFGSLVEGARRTFLGGSVQPSEPAKIIIIIYVSAWLTSKGARIRDVQVGLVPFSVLMGVIAVLIVSQPDISTTVLIVSTALLMFFIAGAELKQLCVVIVGATITFWVIITNSVYARSRVERYLDSIWNPLQTQEWQVKNAIEALTRGGPVGEGMGNGISKHGAVPLSWSDFIFVTISEELGLLGGLLVVLLFALFAYRGLRTALNASDNFGMLLATGITSLLILQALLHIAVAVAVVPPTGMTLPFISYGGSAMVTAMGAVGILLSISRYGQEQASATVGSSSRGKAAYARFDFGRRNGRTRLSSTSGRRATAKRTPAKRTPAKRTPAKRTPAKRGTTKRTPAKRSTKRTQ